ncbi:hypothetical protein ACH4E8_34255 [Streptomyces sp. NPDC017979]|uniref:hypothetical protein n=1 Tax=Streptomyces sp. NPDC017979 TaxID=3365024 RepID=UPI0037A5933E
MQSREFDRDFRDTAERTRLRGLGLLVLAGLLWAWCAVLLLTPYEAEREFARFGRDTPEECGARLLTDQSTANDGIRKGDYCQAERDWPEAVAVLGLSLPVSIAGTVLFTTGFVSRRMSAHSQAMRELDAIAERAGSTDKGSPPLIR